MGIQLGSNFTVNTALPLDDRLSVADLTERDALALLRRYEGLIVYVIAERTNYQLVGGLTDEYWTELSGSGGSGAIIESGSEPLLNDSANIIDEIGEYLADTSCLIVDYYIYRRTVEAQKRMSGRLRIEGVPDAATNADKWQIFEQSRSEFGGDSGVTFSLTEDDVEKSLLVVTLDEMLGTDPECIIYYTVTKLLTSANKSVLANNATNLIPFIGKPISIAKCIIVDYYLYRRVDGEFRRLSGKLILEGVPDGATSADKWQLFEAERFETGAASGVTFSLSDLGTDKSILQIDLDNMTGTDHFAVFYYKKTELFV